MHIISSAYRRVRDFKLVSALSGICMMLFPKKCLCSGRRPLYETTQQLIIVTFTSIIALPGIWPRLTITQELGQSIHYHQQRIC